MGADSVGDGRARRPNDGAQLATGRPSNIHGALFLRDNIFRSIAHFDADYSRHIEGNTLRLRWDETSLLHLIANRLRFRPGLDSTVSDVRAWNRFAQRELGDREGFRRCLNHTLYRPRDLLVLLNQAAIIAARSSRQNIVNEDIAATAKQISQDRLADLLKEYDTVLPGLDLFTKAFTHQPALSTVRVLVAYLNEVVASDPYETRAAGDFALLGTGADVLLALYGVGFVGMEDASTGRYVFCHDGAPSTLRPISACDAHDHTPLLLAGARYCRRRTPTRQCGRDL